MGNGVQRVCDLRSMCSSRAACATYWVGSVCMAGAKQELLESPPAAAELVKLLLSGAKRAGQVLCGRFAFSCTLAVSWAATGLVLSPLAEVCRG